MKNLLKNVAIFAGGLFTGWVMLSRAFDNCMRNNKVIGETDDFIIYGDHDCKSQGVNIACIQYKNQDKEA